MEAQLNGLTQDRTVISAPRTLFMVFIATADGLDLV